MLHAGHPDVDVLADLVARVLPDHEVGLVQAHVSGCAYCADLLGDAEHVRQLLVADPPEPMPVQVWARLADLVSAEAGQRDAVGVEAYDTYYATSAPEPTYGEQFGYTGENQPPYQAHYEAPYEASTLPAHNGWGQDEWFTQETPAISDWTPDPGFVPHDTSGYDTDTGQYDGQDHPGPHDDPRRYDEGQAPHQWDVDADGAEDLAPTDASRHPRSRRERAGDASSLPARSTRTRRDVLLEGQRRGIARYSRPLAVAAGVVVLAGLGTAALKLLPSTDVQATSAAAGARAASAEVANDSAAGALSAVGAASLTGIQATGTDYSEASLVAKALSLKRLVSVNPVGGGGSATSTSPAAAAAAGAAADSAAAPVAPAASAPAPTTTAASRSTKATGNVQLSQPASLQGCLAALGVRSQRPIAIDLARYQGRDAAIIVLSSRDGGYEVWAVERTCGSGNGGQLAYNAVPAAPAPSPAPSPS